MSDGEAKPEASSGYAGVLGKIADGLKGQPALLFGLGGGVVLLALGATAVDELWMIVLGIVVLMLAALGAWIVGERASRAEAAAKKTVFAPKIGGAQTEEVGAASGGTIGSQVGVQPAGVFEPVVEAKKITATGGGHVASQVGGTAPPPEPAPEAEPRPEHEPEPEPEH
jgi:hypothetical protein